MADLKNPRWMYAKAIMLLAIGVMTFGLLLMPQGLWGRIALQLLMVWAFARAYYFAFYVIEHYIDSGYRFSGLFDFLAYLVRARDKAGNR
jgi:hypothetical protein